MREREITESEGKKKMKCNLVRKSSKVLVKGEEKTYFNYYLEFDNGTSIPVMCYYFPTLNIKDEKKKLDIEKINSRNATRFDTLADKE